MKKLLFILLLVNVNTLHLSSQCIQYYSVDHKNLYTTDLTDHMTISPKSRRPGTKVIILGGSIMVTGGLIYLAGEFLVPESSSLGIQLLGVGTAMIGAPLVGIGGLVYIFSKGDNSNSGDIQMKLGMEPSYALMSSSHVALSFNVNFGD